MSKPNPALAEFSDRELRNELIAREQARKPRARPFRPCDECIHFVGFTGGGDPPDDYNPCAKRHKMSFRMPEGYSDHDYGFYRSGCKDWTKIKKLPFTLD